MTKGAAKMVETEVVIFANNFTNDPSEILKPEVEVKSSASELNNKIDLKGRFARLKKSLRKRSVSIL